MARPSYTDIFLAGAPLYKIYVLCMYRLKAILHLHAPPPPYPHSTAPFLKSLS
uniref:Uncharacterized protein n=1 Tax=Lepeophtheirus salmonis TaxID=72036 RepID=A0A0K2TG05_LEPSM